MTTDTVERQAVEQAATVLTFGLEGESPQTVARKIRNVALFAGTDDMLPVLETVHVTGDGSTLTLEATDRYGLGLETVELTEPLAVPFALLVEARALVAAVKATVAARSLLLVLRPDRDGLTVDDGGGTSIRLPAVNGEFPKTRSLWDAHAGAESAGAELIALDWATLGRLAKVQTDAHRRKPYTGIDPVRFTIRAASKPYGVEIGETFRALVMPVRVA